MLGPPPLPSPLRRHPASMIALGPAPHPAGSHLPPRRPRFPSGSELPTLSRKQSADEWPDDDTFTLPRWQRTASSTQPAEGRPSGRGAGRDAPGAPGAGQDAPGAPRGSRPLPRSSRRR